MLSRACYDMNRLHPSPLCEVNMSSRARLHTYSVYGKLRTAITRFVPEQMLTAAKGCLLKDC